MSYSDDTIRAYLRSELPDVLRGRIEADLETDPELERRIVALDDLAPVIAGTFRQLPTPAHMAGLNAAEPAEAGALPRKRVAGGFVVGLVAAFFAGWSLPDRRDGWRMAVADYQALYTPATVAHLDRDHEAVAADLRRAAAAVGLTVLRAPALEGYRLRRVQILGHGGDALIQMVLVGDDGIPLALCLMQGDDGRHGAARLAGLSSFGWGDGAYQFLLIGDIAQNRLNQLAAQLQSSGWTA
ncbi:MAG: hypothetical protein AAF982_04925 [Pseudomonadota bacterium]